MCDLLKVLSLSQFLSSIKCVVVVEIKKFNLYKVLITMSGIG